MGSTRPRARIHHDPLTGRPVVVAPWRADRPDELAGERITCPFCVGHERLTPPDVLRTAAATAGSWRSRIVPNRYPLVGDLGPLDTTSTLAASFAACPRDTAPQAGGVHEVVIESAAHVASILAIPSDDWRAVWELCRHRLADLADARSVAWATVFKNSGAAAGASLEHVHSQLVGLEFVPPALAAELAATAGSADPFGAVLTAADDDDRVVEQVGDLVAVVPPAPRQPFEAWILPRSPEAFFHETGPDRVAAVATLSQSIVRRLDRLVPRAAYNWWLHQPPFTHHATPPPRWHWHLEILPRIHGLAGFELGTGCHVTTVAAREAAALLREA
jgi:UDPglucose--hexose-1-phosphate uridylyltransferase